MTGLSQPLEVATQTKAWSCPDLITSPDALGVAPALPPGTRSASRLAGNGALDEKTALPASERQELLPDRRGGLITIGLVVSRSYPDLEALPAFLADLEARCPHKIMWVCAETDLEARRLLEDPVLLPLNPWWKVGTAYDGRRKVRDLELLRLCERVYVFQKTGAKTTWNEWASWHEKYGSYPGLRLMEAGKPTRQRGRNPDRASRELRAGAAPLAARRLSV